jgi:RNA polymerase sigma-70 factor, ECF subfamily
MLEASRRSDLLDESDEVLMGRYANGDARAFGLLFDRYEQRVFAFFLQRTESPERARDLFQELFLRLHRSRDRYDPERPFAAWIFKIARNLLADDARHVFQRNETPLVDWEPFAGDRSRIDEWADCRDAARFLSTLSAEERALILAVRVEGFGYDELAVELGKSAAAVRQMACRAMRKLRRVVQAEEAIQSLIGRSRRDGFGVQVE